MQKKEIDQMNLFIEPIKSFVLPGGSKVSSQLHLCRTTCRRAERYVVELTEKEKVNLYLMRGNRDFHLNKKFAELTGCKIIKDPTNIYLNEEKILLMHGDTLCTDDIEYQNYRKLVRSKEWQIEMLKKTLKERLAIAEDLRKKSQEEIKNKDDALKSVRQEDMISFGMIPELIGRLPIVTTMKDLSKDEMFKILVQPKNALVKQYQKLFQIEGIELEFEKDALLHIVEVAKNRNSGARALRAVMEECLMDLMYKVPEMPGVEKLTITKDFILGDAEPRFDQISKKRSA